MRGENLRFFPELRHRVAKMLRVLAYDSGGAALPELLRPGRWQLLIWRCTCLTFQPQDASFSWSILFMCS